MQKHERRTCRLSAAPNGITLALGGSAGARLAEQLGILACGSTLLRGLRKRAEAAPSIAPRVVGIDDWAWRKGQRYGTIFCNLENGKAIDLLPDRSAASIAEWLRAHPGIEMLSRDRAMLYAEAADRAVPHAVQIADRWHLLRNLSEALTNVLTPHHRMMAEAARAVWKPPQSEAIEISGDDREPTRAEHGKRQRRERRTVRYESVMTLVRSGKSQSEISRTLGIDRRTVRRWIRAIMFRQTDLRGSERILGPRQVDRRSSGSAAGHADLFNRRIRKVDTSGTISTVAGNGIGGYVAGGAVPTTAEFRIIHGIATGSAGNVYIADQNNERIRMIDVSASSLAFASTAAGATCSDSPQTGLPGNLYQ